LHETVLDMVLHGTARILLDSDHRVFGDRNSGVGDMTERERDERDLVILKQYEMQTTKAELMRRYGVGRRYLDRLIKEALV